METRPAIQISTRAFLQSAAILLALMIVAGALTLLLPAGRFDRALVEGREVVLPETFRQVDQPDYPIWRWLTAPIEVLGGAHSLTVITILIFILMVGASFAVLDGAGILRAALQRVVERLGGQKYALLLAVSLFFMLLGAFFGIFEEVVPLVPLMIALAHSLGWDALVGLGMSILATNVGFSAAITNPFTIGVAQQLAGLPLYSGTWIRIPIFVVFYVLLAVFLTRYARRIERDPESSPIAREDHTRDRPGDAEAALHGPGPRLGPALAWFGAFLAFILVVLVAGPFIPAIRDYALPLVGILFLVGGIGAGVVSGAGGGPVLRMMARGLAGIAPAIPLILMAASVQHIVTQGGVMDTLLYRASLSFAGASPVVAAIAIYLLTLLIEFFVASASAKAVLLMPILVPLADLIHLTRQTAVLAYCFGDGFSNLVYPTNPVLLISLGLTVVTYPKWLRWSLGLWIAIAAVSVVFLALAVAARLGPF